MRFKPFMHRPQALDFNTRKEAHFRRKQEREANALPLFSEQVREHQHDWDAEKRKRQTKSDSIVVAWRAREASVWRRARAMYFELPTELRAQCKRDWETIFRGAWSPTNLIYLVEKFNGIGAERRAHFAAETRAMNMRIEARLTSQAALL